ncbi:MULTISPECIES: hypothetical protein [unclassified Streptomyces]|uniref:hypothetical protein n=1 Tax=unclassified Streptomyces TaxID=2593676 RepID=UPI002E2E1989|nr:hypothetical protein [Streptomyces sp. NBC_01439]
MTLVGAAVNGIGNSEKGVKDGHCKAAVICVREDGGGDVSVHSLEWKDERAPSFIACPPFTSVKSGGIITRSH